MAKLGLLLFVLAWGALSARAASAVLQGLSAGTTNWVAGNLAGWKELDLIPCRVDFTSGPATNQTVVLQFDHTKTSGSTILPGIQSLFSFSNSPNIIITSGPTLSAPAGVDTWYFTLVLNYIDANEGVVTFFARLSAGAHNFTGSSLALKGSLNGSPSPGVLQIAKPGAAPGNPDLAITKLGPAAVNPGSTFSYTLIYTNQAGSAATGVQLTDVLPGVLTLNNCSGGCYTLGSTVTWDLGNIARGAGGSFVYEVLATNFAVNGTTFMNSAAILSAENDMNYNNNYASVTTTITNGCLPPSISSNPVGSTNCTGVPVTFSALSGGTVPHYQWRKNGLGIPGASANTYSIASPTIDDSGSFDVIVTNLCGAVTSSPASLLVLPLTSLAGPTNRIACPGDNVTFSTTVSGTGPFSFQWFKDGIPLADQTNSSIALSNVTASSGGAYSVQVVGSCNSVTNSANLTVNVATTADALVSQTNCPGDTVSFSTLAHGTGPFSFQWFKDGAPLGGQTASSLTLSSITASSAGSYAVQVTGACNNVTNSAILTVNVPTTADALVSLTNCSGDTVSFSTSPHGTGPFSFQWFKNGASLGGQTGSSLTLSSITASSAGSYSVQVRGVCNSVTNSASLTVNVPTTADALVSLTNCSGDTVSFSTLAHGTGPFSFRWFKDGAPLGGQTGSSLTLSSITASSAGSYSVQVTGVCNSVTNFASLTVNVPTTADALASLTNCPGATVSFSTSAHGTGPFSFQWFKDGAPLGGQTGSSLTLSSITASSAGSYSVQVTGACNSVTNSASLTVNVPTTADALVSLTNCPGATVGFSTSAHGTGPFSFQWFKDGASLGGQTGSSLTLSSITASSAGSYSVQVTGVCNTVTNFASLTVNVPTTADALVSLTNCSGDTVSFSTLAHGTGPFSFQWFKDGAPLGGQTGSSLMLSSITASSAGSYSVQVAGACNSVTNSASLTVNVPTSADALVSLTNCAGDTVSFSTAAHGTGPFSFQWFKDGAPLGGQTGSSLTLSGIAASSAGSYSVQVTGACNSVTNLASLTVNVPTTADALVSQTSCPGDTITFVTTAHGTGPFTCLWSKDGKLLPGGTNNWVTMSNVTVLAQGNYSVVVSGACSSVTNNATLMVTRPVTATPLVDQTRCFGQSVTFATTVSGAGSFNCQWKKDGSLLPGQTGSSFAVQNLKASDAGLYSVEITGPCNGVTNAAMLAVESDGLVSPATFANPEAIIINDFNPATPYPSTINVSCVPDAITKLTVTMTNLNHTYASDVTALLVSPDGQAILLMADTGANTATTNATLTFDDDAPLFLPLTTQLISGRWKPTSYDNNETIPLPAPPAPTMTTLAGFNGASANGTWSLFVIDDAPADVGSIAGGWSLAVTWGGAVPPPRLSFPAVPIPGSFQATLIGQSGKTYVIEASTDLTSWTPVATNTLSGTNWTFTNSVTPGLRQRLYRAVFQP